MSPDYSRPTRKCDLVMKGGVTSGLVYPRAVLELATEYEFKSIGGTSAGAVAAAFTAAAEFNRGGGGFEQLNEMNEELQQNDKLRSLFQASATTRPLLTLVENMPDYKRAAGQALTSRGMLRRAWAGTALALKVLSDSGVPGIAAGQRRWAFRAVAAAVFIAAAIGLLAWSFGADAPVRTFLAAAGVLAALLGVLGWVLGGLATGLYALFDIVTEKVPANHFGVCSGLRADDASNTPEAMTEWMHRQIQRIAGREDDAILTVGDLASRGIELQTVTTSLNLGRPYVLPFPEGKRAAVGGTRVDVPFIFRKSDFGKLFPAPVVAHLEQAGFRDSRWRLPEGFAFLPSTAKFPVVIAARMSMSFPLFFSAVPLYQLPHSLVDAPPMGGQVAADDLIPHWFSDGGIASNFPIHFFDAWLPTRPTFGITLRYLPEAVAKAHGGTVSKHYYDARGRQKDARAAGLAAARQARAQRPDTPDDVLSEVWLPDPGMDVGQEWSPLADPGARSPGGPGSVIAFLWSVFTTAQNHRDNMQSELPGYAERIVQVRLDAEEGGFNLRMPTGTIQGVVRKGKEAGETLRKVFEFDKHQWVRFRMLTEQLAEAFKVIKTHEANGELDLLALHSAQRGAAPPYPWPLDPARCTASERQVLDFSAFMASWAPYTLYDLGPGDPLARLRMTPRI